MTLHFLHDFGLDMSKYADTDNSFGSLMCEWGIQPPTDAKREIAFDIDWFRVMVQDRGKERKGRNTCRVFASNPTRCGHGYAARSTGGRCLQS